MVRVSDGPVLGTTPFSQAFPAGGEPVEVRIEKPGFEARDAACCRFERDWQRNRAPAPETPRARAAGVPRSGGARAEEPRKTDEVRMRRGSRCSVTARVAMIVLVLTASGLPAGPVSLAGAFAAARDALTPGLAQAAPARDRREMRAREAYAAGRYQDALDLYVKLYAEKLHPNFLRNIGRCYQNLGEPDKAISSFREYLRKARRLDRGEREEIEGYIREMEQLKQSRAAASEPAARHRADRARPLPPRRRRPPPLPPINLQATAPPPEPAAAPPSTGAGGSGPPSAPPCSAAPPPSSSPAAATCPPATPGGPASDPSPPRRPQGHRRAPGESEDRQRWVER